MAYFDIAFLAALLYANLDALYSIKRKFLCILKRRIERQSIGRNRSIKCVEIVEIDKT